MRDLEARFIDDAILIGQDVDVDLARAPARSRAAPEAALDRLQHIEEGIRVEVGLHLEHLVEEAGLVDDPDRVGLLDRRGAQDPDAAALERLPGPAQVPSPITQVAAQCQPCPAHGEPVWAGRTMASAMRATRTMARTSWTRTRSTPAAIANATAAAVPSSLSSTGRSRVLPMKDLRDGPTRRGRPRLTSSPIRRTNSRF